MKILTKCELIIKRFRDLQGFINERNMIRYYEKCVCTIEPYPYVEYQPGYWRCQRCKAYFKRDKWRALIKKK